MNIMTRFIFSIIAYFILLFKKKVRTGFPCPVSPHFLRRNWKLLDNVYLGSAYLGGGVKISRGCSFYNDPFVFGDVKIGRYTSINGPGTRICSQVNHIKIGAFCSIASNVIIQEFNHHINHVTSYDILSHVCGESDSSVSKGPILIQDGVWIGSNAVILSGVEIGRGAIVGAGAVVTKNVPPYSIVAGNPARVVKYRFSKVAIDEIEGSKWWEWDEIKIKKNKDFFKKEFE